MQVSNFVPTVNEAAATHKGKCDMKVILSYHLNRRFFYWGQIGQNFSGHQLTAH